MPWVARSLEKMVFERLAREQAALAKGRTEESLRLHCKRLDVQQYYLRLCYQFRTGERHRNLHQAVRIRDESGSDKARLEAIKVLETEFDAKNNSAREGLHVNINIAPGYIADISTHADKARAILEQSKAVKPTNPPLLPGRF